MSQQLQNIESLFMEEVKKYSGLTVAAGAIIVLMGMLAMGSPFIVGISLTIAVGIMLIIGGVGHLIFTLKTRAGLFSLILAALTVITGIYMLMAPGPALATLTLFLAIYLVVSGVFEVLMALQIKPAKGWSWLLISGVVSLILGAMIWVQFPVSGIWAIGTLIGIKLMFTGWTVLMFGIYARAMVKKLV